MEIEIKTFCDDVGPHDQVVLVPSDNNVFEVFHGDDYGTQDHFKIVMDVSPQQLAVVVDGDVSAIDERVIEEPKESGKFIISGAAGKVAVRFPGTHEKVEDSVVEFTEKPIVDLLYVVL